MICTWCQKEIPFLKVDVTVVVCYREARWPGDKRASSYCHHNPFDESDPNILAILGSNDCLINWQRRKFNEELVDKSSTTTETDFIR